MNPADPPPIPLSEPQAIPQQSSGRYLAIFAALFVFGVSLVAFLPAAQNGFINWDDEAYFIQNPHIRGLGWDNFVWFFTTTHVGHYQPLNWLSYAVDYSLSGLHPGRFHLTQAILHALAALLFFVLARMLLQLAKPSASSTSIIFSGALAALLFSLHPLRVESVAWASARADILATIFYLATLIVYVDGTIRAPDRALSPGRLAWTITLFLAALLCKEMAVTLPAILLLFDVYPLRRLRFHPQNESRPFFRRVLLEKIPFFALSALVTANAFHAAGGGVAGFTSHPLSLRLAQFPVSLVFYLQKTLLPTSLSPLYDYPPNFGWGHPRVWISIAVLAVLITLLWRMRKRAPVITAAAIAYAILILPVTGLTQRGMQLTADRYSYLSCLPWALLGGYGLVSLARHRRGATALLTLVLLVTFVYLTRTQTRLWVNSITLWEHAAKLDSYNSGAFAHLGQAYETAGRHDEAINAYKKAVSLRPHHPDVQRNLAAIYNRQFRNQEAIDAYLADLADNPDRRDSHYYLALTYERVGDDDSALKHYRETLRISPDDADAHAALGRLFLKHTYVNEAEPRLRRAIELSPGHLEALELLARLCADTGRRSEAGDLMQRAVEEARRRGDESLAVKLQDIRQQLLSAPASRPATSR